MHLNEFQRQCSKTLTEALACENLAQTEEIKGNEETYIEDHIPNTNLELYIYIDGASVFSEGRKIDIRLEHQDFDTLLELQRTFINKVLGIAKQAG